MTPGSGFGSTRRKRLPEGVNPSLWAYATSQRLADDETHTFADHPLIKTDLNWIKEKLGTTTGLAADLGCGSGRASAMLANIGWNVISIDLSPHMLAQFIAENQPSINRNCLCVQGNLARLGFISDGSLDSAVCLFSTLGMIPRKHDRQLCLNAICCALKPGGKLLIHAHNWFVQHNHRQGLRWMAFDTFRQFTGHYDYGNRDAQYRGIPGVKIHMFHWNEIRNSLALAGLHVKSVVNLHSTTAQNIGNGFLNRHFRSGGWLIEATKP
ncbi:MAG: class I SAM-dependent methyltransferase [Planctomycetota bacterium]